MEGEGAALCVSRAGEGTLRRVGRVKEPSLGLRGVRGVLRADGGYNSGIFGGNYAPSEFSPWSGARLGCLDKDKLALVTRTCSAKCGE